MKKILITGANSYIGISFEDFMKEYTGYKIDTLDMRNPEWKKYDFSRYDTVFHVAGIAHTDVSRVSEEKKKLYYKVNCDLAVDTAKKAKSSGVKQFIFMSSIIVYGESAPCGKKKVITSTTKPTPANFYGDSKLQAELKLKALCDAKFNICILRPPMIYGPGCKGNYPILAKLAKILPIFPYIKNERSILFIGNFCFFVKECIDNNSKGIFFPQNSEYVTTTDLVKEIANIHLKRIFIIKLLNPFVYIISKFPGRIGRVTNKAFGSISYEKNCLINEYTVKDSIRITEEKN